MKSFTIPYNAPAEKPEIRGTFTFSDGNYIPVRRLLLAPANPVTLLSKKLVSEFGSIKATRKRPSSLKSDYLIIGKIRLQLTFAEATIALKSEDGMLVWPAPLAFWDGPYNALGWGGALEYLCPEFEKSKIKLTPSESFPGVSK
ncbi:MAG: hypothetical protein AAFU85_22515 [Planctomycetota bacterium]